MNKTLYQLNYSKSKATAISSKVFFKNEKNKYQADFINFVYFQKNDLFIFLERCEYIKASYFLHIRTGKVVTVYDCFIKKYRKQK